MKKRKKIYGHYITLDLYDCDPVSVGSLKICYEFLSNLPKIVGVKGLSTPSIVVTDAKKYPDKAGLSGWIPKINDLNGFCAGASIHTLTPTNFISLDIFSPEKTDLGKILKFVRSVFRPKKIEKQYFIRGEFLDGN